MATQVININNVGNGLDVDVTLNGAASGTITARASRLPLDPSTQSCTVTPQGGNVYRVRLRDGTVHKALPVRLFYYVQVLDAGVQLTSYQIGTDNLPASETGDWVCLGDNRDWLDQCERAWLDILVDNFQALNRGMELHLRGLGNTVPTLPDGTPAQVQSIHAGLPAFEQGLLYPQISLRSYEVQDDPYWANPRSDYLPIKTRITAYLCHQGDVNWEPLTRALGMAIFNILNQDHYVEITLDSGLKMGDCYALTGTSDESPDSSAECWVGSFTLEVQSKVYVGRETL